MTITELTFEGIRLLKKHSPTPGLDTEIIIEKVLKKTKEFLYTNPSYKITDKQLEKCRVFLKRRQAGEPIAYLTNKKEFYGLDFYVNESVLIPRPETEIIIDNIISSLKKYNQKDKFVLADIGTGSGCIAVTLAKILPDNIKHVYATDISSKILNIARRNALRHRVNKKISFMKGSLLEPLKNKKIDILVANLPYLPDNNIKEYYKKSKGLRYEPKKSLFTKDNGWYWYKALLKQVSAVKNKPRLIFLEIDHIQKNKSSAFNKILDEVTFSKKIKTIKDPSGYDIIIKINV